MWKRAFARLRGTVPVNPRPEMKCIRVTEPVHRHLAKRALDEGVPAWQLASLILAEWLTNPDIIIVKRSPNP